MGKKIHGDTNRNSKHNYIYRLWQGIITRCYKIDYVGYKDWGGRGIIMYQPWINNYPLFKSWILENLGERPESNYSIDRIDNDGNYEPGNLRWATKFQQTHNRRYIDRKGEKNTYSKLTEKQILEIRNLYSTGDYTLKNIGIIYNVTFQLISHIVRKDIWTHI